MKKALIIGILIYILGFIISGTGFSTIEDNYMSTMIYIHKSILYLASVIAVVGYLILKNIESYKN